VFSTLLRGRDWWLGRLVEVRAAEPGIYCGCHVQPFYGLAGFSYGTEGPVPGILAMVAYRWNDFYEINDDLVPGRSAAAG